MPASPRFRPNGSGSINISVAYGSAPEVVKEKAQELAGKSANGELTYPDVVTAWEKAPANSAEKQLLYTMKRAAETSIRNNCAPKPELWDKVPQMKSPAEGSEGSTASVVPESITTPTANRGNPVTRDFLEKLNKLIIGQESTKEVLARFQESLSMGFDDDVRCLGIGGPPGVGKTEMVKALAEILYGNPDAIILIEGGKIQDKTNLNDIFGSSRGFVGSDLPPTFDPDDMVRKFGDQPPLILIDEADKIGQSITDPAAQKALRDGFWNEFNTALNDAKMTLKDGRSVNLKNARVIVTSNAGMDSAGDLKGQALRDHYVASMVKQLPKQIQSRFTGNFCAADPLTEGQCKDIAGLELSKRLKRVVESARKKDKDISFDVDPALLTYIGEIGQSDANGARPIKAIVRDLMVPLFGKMAAAMGDEEVWTASLSSEVSQRTLQNIKDAFKAEENGGIPDGISTENFPIQFTLKSRPARFESYDGTIPHDPAAPVLPLAAGVVGGESFIVLDKQVEGSTNDMYLVRPGFMESDDKFVKVKMDDAPRLAEASHALNVTSLSENELFFLGVHAPERPEDGDEGEAMAYIYNHATKSFTEVAEPPMALVDAQVVAIDESRVLVTGGRSLYAEAVELSDGSEGVEWSLKNDPHLDCNLPIEQETWIYDRTTNAWSTLSEVTTATGDAQKPQTPRVGAATFKRGDEIWFMGGEERVQRPNGTYAPQASAAVDIFDTKTFSWRKGPELPTAAAYAKAIDDGRGGIQLVGGAQRVLNGTRWELEPMELGFRIAPDADQPVWKPSAKPIVPAAGLEAFPYGEGHVVGPFFLDDDSDRPTFEYLG